MLYYALVFLVVAPIACFLGFGGVAFARIASFRVGRANVGIQRFKNKKVADEPVSRILSAGPRR
jgi:hypothetical protein